MICRVQRLGTGTFWRSRQGETVVIVTKNISRKAGSWRGLVCPFVSVLRGTKGVRETDIVDLGGNVARV